MKHIKIKIMDNPINPDSCMVPNGEKCEFLYEMWGDHQWWCTVFWVSLRDGGEGTPVRCNGCRSSEVAR